MTASRLRRLVTIAAMLTFWGPNGAVGATSAVIFMYHHVSEDTPPSTSVSPAVFRAHMAHLEREGYAVMPFMDVVAALQAGDSLPERTVVLTFDDGYDSVLTQALPELEARGWPFTVFVSPTFIDRSYGGYLSWDELRHIAAAGGTIGNHTMTHAHLVRRAPGETDTAHRERIRLEIAAAAERIAAEVPSGAIAAFAYPYGEYDPTVAEVVAGIGLVAVGQHSGAIGATSDWHALPRFPIATGFDDIEEFALRARTMPLPIKLAQPHWTLNDTEDRRPVFSAMLTVDLPRRSELACYASGQGRIPVDWEGSSDAALRVRPNNALSPGRTKVNCTVPHGSVPGVYWWFGKLWITPMPDGSWYAE